MAMFQQKVSSKVTLDDTIPLICTIETAQNVKDHIEYCLRVQRGWVSESSWTIHKRYSHFAQLESVLKISGIELPLPPKKVFGNMEREFIAERQQGLQYFMNIILDNHHLSTSLHVKQFLDASNYKANLQEVALQHISMFFRSETRWEVVEPAPDIGWRVRQRYFMIKDIKQPKATFILSWSSLGPDKHLNDDHLQALLRLLPTFQHPHIYPVAFSVANETSAIAIRTFCEKGTLRDTICKCKPKLHYLKKYGKPKICCTCPLQDIKTYGRQILETLKYLHEKGLPYGHLHASNVIVEDGKCRLLGLENWLIGIPSYYRCYFTQYKKIRTMELIDVYCFGHLLFEMTFGEQLHSPVCDTFPPSCHPEVRSVLESILTTEACKNGLPSVSDLLLHSLFSDVIMPTPGPAEKPQVKIPSKLKESLREAKNNQERRLNEEQKVINKVKRMSKAQAFHMSDEEKKKRRRNHKKQLSEQLNGEEERDIPNSTSKAPSSSTQTSADKPRESAPVGPAPPPPPPPPPPPAPDVTNNNTTSPPPDAGSDRKALLGSISAFNKGALKKAVTSDRSTPLT